MIDPSHGEWICLDSEFANSSEIIELSIYDFSGTELYHDLYKPRRMCRHDQRIHHITRGMVAGKLPFEKSRERVQGLIDNARFIAGFAIDNDLAMLAGNGITGLDDKTIVELRDWFWINHGLTNHIDYQQGVSLKSCCECLGVVLESGEAHRAGADTFATLECFRILLGRFITNHHIAEKARFEDVHMLFSNVFRQEFDEYERAKASGVAYLTKTDTGYKLNIRPHLPPDDDSPFMLIEVEDRFRAKLELPRQFERRLVRDSGTIYALRPSDLDFFIKYRAPFDAEYSRYCKSALKLGAHMAR